MLNILLMHKRHGWQTILNVWPGAGTAEENSAREKKLWAKHSSKLAFDINMMHDLAFNF